MDVNIPSEDYTSLKTYINQSIIDCDKFMDDLSKNSKRCTMKAFDNIPILVFSTILHRELGVIIELYDYLQNVEIRKLNYLPNCYCNEFGDEEIGINNNIEFNIFVIHIIHQIILEFIDFMKILYSEDYSSKINNSKNSILTKENYAFNLYCILTFMDYEHDDIYEHGIDNLLECFKKSKKSQFDINIVLIKMNNIISSVSNLRDFMIELCGKHIKKNNLSIMFNTFDMNHSKFIEEEN